MFKSKNLTLKSVEEEETSKKKATEQSIYKAKNCSVNTI